MYEPLIDTAPVCLRLWRFYSSALTLSGALISSVSDMKAGAMLDCSGADMPPAVDVDNVSLAARLSVGLDPDSGGNYRANADVPSGVVSFALAFNEFKRSAAPESYPAIHGLAVITDSHGESCKARLVETSEGVFCLGILYSDGAGGAPVADVSDPFGVDPTLGQGFLLTIDWTVGAGIDASLLLPNGELAGASVVATAATAPDSIVLGTDGTGNSYYCAMELGMFDSYSAPPETLIRYYSARYGRPFRYWSFA